MVINNLKELKFHLPGGIKIVMHAREHRPPHVNACYGQKKDRIAIQTQKVIDSPPNLSTKQRKICEQWIRENKELLLKKWNELEEMGTIPVSKKERVR